MKPKNESEKTQLYKYLLLNGIFFLFVCIFVGLLIVIPKIEIPRISEKSIEDNRTYNIMIVGEYNSAPFMKKVYEGARKIVSSYDAVIDYHVPRSNAENVDFYKLLDFASFSNVDGIIAYVPEKIDSIRPVVNRNGVSIPIVTIGKDVVDSPHIAHIGSNFFETGKVIAQEIITWYDENTTVLIIDSSEKASYNYSSLQRGLLSTLNSAGIEKIEILENNTSLFKGVFTSKIMEARNEDRSLIVECISEADTVNVASQISDLMYSSKTKIIGGGQNEAIQNYFDKGIITELISLDCEAMGESAIEQIFEYKAKGSANRIVNVSIKIRKAGKNEKEK